MADSLEHVHLESTVPGGAASGVQKVTACILLLHMLREMYMYVRDTNKKTVLISWTVAQTWCAVGLKHRKSLGTMHRLDSRGRGHIFKTLAGGGGLF